jgi:acyl-CoA dehydrogenase
LRLHRRNPGFPGQSPDAGFERGGPADHRRSLGDRHLPHLASASLRARLDRAGLAQGLWRDGLDSADAPVLFASGLRSLGPLLIELGTDAQRRKYLPAILSGDDLWCQGFSEPGAGSDLAAIATRAVRRDAVYVVTGSKIWTTGAHLANRMFAIVRTADGARRQEGLTFLLIDMESPGITVRPIIDLGGEHEFNQVFFDRVRVPIGDRVGEENDGWSVA